MFQGFYQTALGLGLLGPVCVALVSPRTANAELPPQVAPLDTQEDGVYGRFAGDLDLGIGAGLRFAEGGAGPATRLSLHYYSTAGLSASYADRFSQGRFDRHTLSVSADLKPAFIPRWSLDLQRGPATLDLALDSISLGLGAYWAAPGGKEFGASRGLESSLGFGVPLLAEAAGPWLELRGAWLFPDHSAERSYPTLTLNLAWHSLLTTPLSKNAP